ncbi:MAG: TIGR00341 family protein [Longimicrobiales bacterium]
MPLRLLEATVPEDRMEEVVELLQDVRFVQFWITGATDGMGFLRVLVDAGDTEVMSDLLVSRFGSREDFRLMLFSVEATLPVLEEPKKTEEAEAEEEEAEEAQAAKEKAEKKKDEEEAEEKTGPKRISREELYEDINHASRLDYTYLVMTLLSSVVAAVGLIRGEVAIIIGAMVIAPLLGPNIGLSLASTLGDIDLAKRSLKAMGVGVVAAAAVSVLVGIVFTVDPQVPELASRTRAGLGDIVIALAAGTAGSLAFTSGVPTVVVGVMVAVALLPPLVAAGLLAGAGFGSEAFGAVMLLVINVTCINLAAVATFLAQRVRPRTWWEADRAKKATRVAVTAWVLMLVLLLALIWFRHIRAI